MRNPPDQIRNLGKLAAAEADVYIIKGNPAYLDAQPENYDPFYAAVKKQVEDQGFTAEFDRGETNTLPPGGKYWIGHSRGGSRLRYAPEGVKTLRLDDYEPEEERARSKEWRSRLFKELNVDKVADIPIDKRPVPGPAHYTLNDDQKNAIRDLFQIQNLAKTAAASDNPAGAVVEAPMYLQSYIPRTSLEQVREHGLLSGNELAKPENRYLLDIARPNGDADRWLKERDERLLNSPWTNSYNGPSVLFGDVDDEKIHAKHPIKKFDSARIRIKLDELLRDYPDTKMEGSELIPFSDETYDALDEKGKDEFVGKRHHTLALEEIRALLARGQNPKDMWKDFTDTEGNYYASDVPHAQVVTPMGKIPSSYIDFGEDDTDIEQLAKMAASEALNEAGKDMYHGSEAGPLSRLEPRTSRLLDGSPAVFGTHDRDVALSFSAPWSDDDIEHGNTNGQYYMKEKRPKAFEELFGGRQGHIHRFPDTGFSEDPRLTNYERISSDGVDVQDVEKIEDMLKALMRSKFKMIKHDEVPQASAQIQNLAKTAASDALQQLIEAKSESDRKNYAAKHAILRKLLAQYPGDFKVDAATGKYHGLTHNPSGFKIHAPRDIAGMAKAAAAARTRAIMPHGEGYLMERMNNPKFPDNLGRIRFPGGGVDEGETSQQAIIRELLEELSLNVKPEQLTSAGMHEGDFGPEEYFNVADHGLVPGNYTANVGGDKEIELIEGRTDSPDFWGSDPAQLGKIAASDSKDLVNMETYGGAVADMLTPYSWGGDNDKEKAAFDVMAQIRNLGKAARRVA